MSTEAPTSTERTLVPTGMPFMPGSPVRYSGSLAHMAGRIGYVAGWAGRPESDGGDRYTVLFHDSDDFLWDVHAGSMTSVPYTDESREFARSYYEQWRAAPDSHKYMDFALMQAQS